MKTDLTGYRYFINGNERSKEEFKNEYNISMDTEVHNNTIYSGTDNELLKMVDDYQGIHGRIDLDRLIYSNPDFKNIEQEKAFYAEKRKTTPEMEDGTPIHNAQEIINTRGRIISVVRAKDGIRFQIGDRVNALGEIEAFEKTDSGAVRAYGNYHTYLYIGNIFHTSVPRDSVVGEVCEKFLQRSGVGIKKYGTTLDRGDIPLKDWITHAIEEMMDMTLYLQRALRDLA